MSSRKEQKEQLRREREQREAAAQAAGRRRRLIGYGVGAGLVAVALVAAAVLLASGGGDDGGGGGSASSDVLPDGGSVPEPKGGMDLATAAEAAGCELESSPADSRVHVEDIDEEIDYATNPPTAGSHFAEWAEDDAYEDAPDVKRLVHALEHGRVIIWFKKSLPASQRANVKALYDEDTYQMLLTPNETNMPYAVAASAWNAEPRPNGTGRLLGCPEYNEAVFDAIRAFKDEHRGNGPEVVQ
jgi:hypothetical protein